MMKSLKNLEMVMEENVKIVIQMKQPFFELENLQGDNLLNFYPLKKWPANDTPCASCSCNKNL